MENEIYVDDIVSGSYSLEQAIRARDELIELCNHGGFELRKWTSNNTKFFEGLPEQNINSQSFSFTNDDNSTLKILGLQWHMGADVFSFKIKPKIETTCTKRLILSNIARIYDPLGFLCPITFFAKRFIQQLWGLGMGWDEIPPYTICEKWLKFISDLPRLAEFNLPRYFVISDYTYCELHGFSDASEKGYAAVTYFRFQKNDNYHTFFVIAKSKVSPLKNISIPRLELLGAALLSKLLQFVIDVFKDKIFFS